MRLLGSIVAALLIAGCTGELTYEQPGTGGGGGGGGGGAGPDAGASVARAMFDSQIAPIFSASHPKGACTVCRQAGGTGPAVLGVDASSHYQTITTFAPPVIAATPNTSTLY